MTSPHSRNEESPTRQNVSYAESSPSLVESEQITDGTVFQSVSGVFSRIFADAAIVKVDPLRCISIQALKSRPICRWGVKKIKRTILGKSSSESFVSGFVSTGKFSVIVEIPEEQKSLVVQYFEERGKTHEQAMTLASSGKWFHTVEGSHLHRALVECIEEISEKFAGFRWPVVEISWQPAETLRAISRMCNEIQKDEHVIDSPLPDAMQSLRDIIDSHSKDTGVAIIPGERSKPGFIKEVVEIYAGGQGYSCNTLRTVCGSVMKMSSTFVSSMRSLLTEECDDTWKALGAKRPFGDDTRIFKKLLSTQSLKRTPKFLDQKSLTDEDRVNVIHRLRFIAKERESFKSFSSIEIESQSQHLLAAKREVEHFDAFLGSDKCPNELENIKHNMLQTTLLDAVVREHTAGQQELLPVMVNAYLKATGAHGSQKMGQYRRRLELEDVDDAIGVSACHHGRSANEGQERDVRPISESNVEKGCSSSEELESGTREENQNTNSVNQAEENPDTFLNEAGVELRIETLLEYERESLGIDGSFDFVIADPFQKIGTDPSEERSSSHSPQSNITLDELVDEKGVNLYVQSIRRLLRRGGYFFVFLDWNRIHQWKTCCIASQFDVVCEPFLIMKDPSRVQKMTLKGLQSIYEPAIVLRKPGEHPDGFEMNKTSPYTHLPACRSPRWCNVIDGVPPAAQKVTFRPSRAKVRPNEKPCSLYIELLTTFCPTNGKVLDPFAATLTMGLACMGTGRLCVLLETDEKCILYAKSRAVDFAKSRIGQGSGERQDFNLSGSENEETPGRSATADVETAVEEEQNEIERNDFSGPPQNNRSGAGRSVQEIDPASDNEPREATHIQSSVVSSTPNAERENASPCKEKHSHRLSTSYSPSVSKTCKQLSFVTSENRNMQEGRVPELGISERRTPVICEISTPIAKKRNRKVRSPPRTYPQTIESNTPSRIRRSKRSRKTNVQYGH